MKKQSLARKLLALLLVFVLSGVMALPVFAEEANGNENGNEYENGYDAEENGEEYANDEDEDADDEDDYVEENDENGEEDEVDENGEEVDDEDDNDEYAEDQLSDIEPITEPAVQELTVEVDGVEVVFVDQGPEMVANRVLVPVRGVFDAMGFDEPDWNRNTREATLTRGDVEIVIPADGATFTVNGEVVTPDVPQRMMNNRLMLPLGAIAEAVGATTSWDPDTQTAHIITEPVVDEPEEDEDEPVVDEDYDEEDEEPANEYDYDYDDDDDEDADDNDVDDDDEDADDADDDDDNEMLFADHPLVGAWENDDYVYVFYGDLTGTVTRGEVVYEMEWVPFEGTLTLRVPGFDLIGVSMWDYSIENGTLTLENRITDVIVVLVLV